MRNKIRAHFNMASRPGQKTAVFDSVVCAMFNGGYLLVYAASTRMFLQWVPADLHGGVIILLFIVLEAVTFMVLYQNYGNTFGKVP